MRWIIGDIHGMLGPLEALLGAIDGDDPFPELIFAGDFVNRGPDSKGVVDLLLSLENAKFCRGNHDDTFDLVLSGKCYTHHSMAAGVLATFGHFLQYGLDTTLKSYGISQASINDVSDDLTLERVAALLAPVPQRHRDFFHTLPVIYAEPDIFVAHAKWPAAEPSGLPSFKAQLANSGKLRHDLVWGRFTLEELKTEKPWQRTGFFGHTPVTSYQQPPTMLPVVGKQMVLLDTACAVHARGRLTGWCVEEKRYIQVERDGEVVESA